MKRLLTFLFLIVSEVCFPQTTITYDTPLPTAYSLFNSNQGLQQSGGTWGYDNGVANSVQTIAEGESVTAQVYLSGHAWGLFLAASKPKTKIVDDQNDNGTWVGSDATAFGLLLSMETSGSVRAFENGGLYGSSQALSNFHYVRIFYENATTVRYQYSTDGSSFTTFQTSAVDPTGSYYVFWQSISPNSIVNLVYKSAASGGGNNPPSITPIDDVVITLPVNSVSLTANATDSDGTIASYSWIKVSGPAGGNISSATTAATNITSLSQGTYLYRVTVTDDDGGVSSEDVGITVLPTGTTGGNNISTTIIPFSDPEIMRHFAGAEDWNGQNQISIPTATNKQNPRSYYFRYRWFEIEDGQGVYDWATFDAPIRAAIDRGQTFSFGIMGVDAGGCGSSWSTSKPNPISGGTCMAYPLYLHNLMMGETVNNRPFVVNVGSGFWVPNYNSPNFLARWKALNEAIYEHLNTTTYNGVLLKNVINYVDVRGYGTWDEWHAVYTAPMPTDWPTGRQPTVPTLDSIISYSVRSYPDIYSVMLISALDAYWYFNTWNDPSVARFALQLKNQSGMFLGIRNDHIGEPTADYDFAYTNLNTRGYTAPTAANQQSGAPTFVPFGIDTSSMNRWRLAPILGEPPGGNTSTGLPRYMRFWRYASFGNGNMGTLITTGPGADSGRLASKLAGHRIQISGGNMPSSISPGGSFFVTLNWQNVGLTPCYDRYNTIISLRSQAGTVVWSDTSSFQPYLFLPGNLSVTDNFVLPSNAPAGVYNLFVRLVDVKGYREALPLAIQGRTSDGSYLLAGNIQVASGGSNQSPVVAVSQINETNTIQLPTSTITLVSSATDPDGTIVSYAWAKVSGPAATITSPTAATTTVTGLVAGVYVFEVTVTDNGSLSSKGSISITVLPATPVPVSPTANAGADSTFQLPKNRVTLIGSGTDPDGTIVSFSWIKVSGPAASIVSPSLSTTIVENLVQGVYVFRLTVTDNSGATGTDEVTVTVLSNSIAVSSGRDRTIYVNKTVLQATYPPNATSISWTKVSGPTAVIVSPTSARTDVTSLVPGTYVFRASVTINSIVYTDDVQIRVSNSRNRRVRSVNVQ